jgi:hypothetical protein
MSGGKGRRSKERVTLLRITLLPMLGVLISFMFYGGGDGKNLLYKDSGVSECLLTDITNFKDGISSFQRFDYSSAIVKK